MVCSPWIGRARGLQISGAGRHHHIFQYFGEQAGAIKGHLLSLADERPAVVAVGKYLTFRFLLDLEVVLPPHLPLEGIALDRL